MVITNSPLHQVDFYQLSTSQNLLRYACLLLEKAYLHHYQTLVCCEHLQQAQEIDQLLWTFKEEQFIPHLFYQDQYPVITPMIIFHQAQTLPAIDDLFPSKQRETLTSEQSEKQCMLLNLSTCIPVQHTSVHRILEIIPHEQTGKTISREHYRFYQQLNIKLMVRS